MCLYICEALVYGFPLLAMLRGMKSVKEKKKTLSLSASCVMLQTTVYQDIGSDLCHVFSHIF